MKGSMQDPIRLSWLTVLMRGSVLLTAGVCLAEAWRAASFVAPRSALLLRPQRRDLALGVRRRPLRTRLRMMAKKNKKERKKNPMLDTVASKYETVVGVECHVQLDTATKAFCSCSTDYDIDSSDPNVHICPVCVGEPGSLPVPNRRVVELAGKAGLALNCEIAPSTKFDRKNYFYPDTPKNYQITQYDRPIAEHGYLMLPSGKRVGIRRLHMEEDSAKMLHIGGDGTVLGADYSLIDFNRAGVPLIEIVSEADIRSGEEAAEYGRELAKVLKYIGASDCVMAAGSLRLDVNVSIRPKGTDELRTKVEVKNVNSFRAVQQAVDYETVRQAELYDSMEGEASQSSIDEGIRQETRTWDEKTQSTKVMRVKEGEADYRYFPEPDIPPLSIDQHTIQQWRNELPELPASKRERYASQLGLDPEDARILTDDKQVAEYLEATLMEGAEPSGAARWVVNDIFGWLGEKQNVGMAITDIKLTPARLAEMLRLIDSKYINGKIAKDLLPVLLSEWDDGSVRALVDERGMQSINDPHTITQMAVDIINNNPTQLQQYRGGKSRLEGFFVGQLMKQSGNRADPTLSQEIMSSLLNAPTDTDTEPAEREAVGLGQKEA